MYIPFVVLKLCVQCSLENQQIQLAKWVKNECLCFREQCNRILNFQMFPYIPPINIPLQVFTLRVLLSVSQQSPW
uniref:Uncharacterized protein n=1 Tax=Anguilla anguilla TaxID=7936 RepID=A0A0E9RLG5_ANGAN